MLDQDDYDQVSASGQWDCRNFWWKITKSVQNMEEIVKIWLNLTLKAARHFVSLQSKSNEMFV